MTILLGLLALFAAPAAAVPIHSVASAAESMAVPIEALVSTGTAVRLRVLPFQAEDARDAVAARAMTEALLDRLVSGKRVVVSADGTADLEVQGAVRREDGVLVVKMWCENVASKAWVYAGVFPMGEARGSLFAAPELWIGAAAAGLGEGIRAQGEFNARGLLPGWEASLLAAGQFDQKDAADDALNTIHQSDLKTVYGRLRVSRLFAVPRPAGDAGGPIPLPAFVSAGAGYGLYSVRERLLTGGFFPADERHDHVYALPFAEVGLIWRLGSRQELRASGSYSAASPSLGVGDHIGGFGFSIGLSARLD